LEVNITSPLPYAGAAIPVNGINGHAELDHALMRFGRPCGMRRFASEADILAAAQISQFTQVNLDPQVDEPGGLLLAGLGLGSAMVLWRVRRRVRNRDAC
jgi:hypothetical protein